MYSNAESTEANYKENCIEEINNEDMLLRNFLCTHDFVSSDINAPNLTNARALHVATEEGNVAIMKILLDRGADINARKKTGRTVLHCAVRLAENQGNLEPLILLLERSADINTEDKINILHFAAQYGFATTINLLLQNDSTIDINVQKKKSGDTPLHLAARHGSAEVITVLLKKEAQTTIQNSNNKTALDIATAKNSTNTTGIFEEIERLLSQS